MMVSTKGRYALRLMIDLAEQPADCFVPLTDVAKRQDISEKYLESIVSALSKNKLLDSVRGKGGGYRLNKPASEYTVSEILNAAEGSIAPVACLSKEENDCPRKDRCTTLKMWEDFRKMTDSYFENITIQDLLKDKE